MMDVKEKLVEIVKRAAHLCLPSNTKDFHLDMFVTDLIYRGVTVREWISVEDRLPEDVYGKDREQIVVLVCTKSGKVSECARMADYEFVTDETLPNVGWIKNGKFFWSKNKAVTHWMPLPQPPKGE